VNRVYSNGELRFDRGKSDAAFRTVALQRRALDALDELPRSLDRHTLVFRAPMGGYINLDNWRKRTWYKALDAAEMERRPPNQMRHTFATLALAAGATLDWVSDQTGHSNLRVTKRFYARYTRPAHDRNLAALDSFESVDDAAVAAR